MPTAYNNLKGRDPYGGFMDWESEFGSSGKVFLEIGVGNGEYIARRAREIPEGNHIGLDCRWDCVSKTLRRVERLRLKNVRLFWADARVMLTWFTAPRSLDGITSLFPCPWPKKRHVKHRLFSREFLRLLNNRLKPKGTCLIVTDYADYRTWLAGEVSGEGFSIRADTVSARYDTKYERKWQEEGKTEFYEIHLEKSEHKDHPAGKPHEMKSYKLKNFNIEEFFLRDVSGDETVIFKETLFDARKNKGLVRAVIADEGLTQTVWIKIASAGDIWHIGLEAGQSVIPTRGAAKALEEVYSAAKASGHKARKHDT